MSRPLPPSDPVRLGPYQLAARLDQTTAGIVYLGTDSADRQVSIAVLNRGAAEDAAACDRFRAAIKAAMPGFGSVPGPVRRHARRQRAQAGDTGPAPVLDARVDGPAPWVATSYEPGRPGAERFLDSVLFKGSFRSRLPGVRRGPAFQPYWAASADPAILRPARRSHQPAGEGPSGRDRAAAISALSIMIALLLVLLLVLLYACGREAVVPDPAPQDVPPPTIEQPTPTPSGPSPAPTSPEPGSPSPGPGQENPDGRGEEGDGRHV